MTTTTLRPKRPTGRNTCCRLLGILTLASMSLTSLAGASDSLVIPTSTLSRSDYANGTLREKDLMRRASPVISKKLHAMGMTLGSPVFIRIFKESRELELWLQNSESGKFKLYKTWKIAAMSGQLGPKTKQGDLQAPEGFYFVPRSRMKPDSRFHLAFNLGYPNTYDRAHGRTGDFLMVHGNRVSIGCFAMTDPGIEEIYTLCAAALNKGQAFFRVHSFPFRMTPERMEQEKNSPHYAFWENLKPGFEWFETHRNPPNVSVRNQSYQFSNPSD